MSDGWVNDVVGHVLDLIEANGVERKGAQHLPLRVLRETWAEWGPEDINDLVNTMSGRRLVLRVAGKEGEELRGHPDARRMHDTYMQRLVAFEEEEEAAFVEEEVLAEQISAREPSRERTHHPSAFSAISEETTAEGAPGTAPRDAYQAPPREQGYGVVVTDSLPKLTKGGGGGGGGGRSAGKQAGEGPVESVEHPVQEKVANLKALFGGEDIRVNGK